MARAVVSSLLDDSGDETQTDLQAYAPSGVQRTLFAVSFLVLLPFFVSLPMMLFQRIAGGVWLDTWGLIVIAAAFSVLMLLLLFELMYALRAEVVIGETAVQFTMPAGGPGRSGLIPMFVYNTHRIDYDDIAAVERRCEVFGGAVAPMKMIATTIVKKDGTPVLLGLVNEANPDHTFPFDRIGEQIAERAGLAVTDIGHVKRCVRTAGRKLLGIADIAGSANVDDSLSEADLAAINRRHTGVVTVLIATLVVLLAISMALDLMNIGRDLGERAPNASIWSLISG